jgi:hypothetical protein
MNEERFLYNMKRELVKDFNKTAHAIELGPTRNEDLTLAPELEREYVGIYDMEDFE